MWGEILSGIIGSTVGEVVGKWFPPRRIDELADIPPEVLHQRNRRLYFGINAICVASFFLPFICLLFLQSTNYLSAWIGAILVWCGFGLPFPMVVIYLRIVRYCLGSRRARELIFYLERQQKTNIYSLCVAGLLFTLFGLFLGLLVVFRDYL